MSDVKKLLLILNPKAGKCRGVKQLPELISLFQENGFLPTVLLTAKSGDASEFALHFGSDHDLIVCVGGDGTLSEVISGVVRGNVSRPIGYIPAGSANDYGSSLGLSADLLTAAGDIITGRPAGFDVGLYNGQPFVYVAAFGTLAKVSYSTSQDVKNLLGHAAYVLEGIRNLPSLQSCHMEIEIDGEPIEGDFILGLISNTLTVGGLLRFDPAQVMMDDGLLEIMLISMPSSPKEFTDTIQAVSTQNYTNCSSIIFRKGQRISIRSLDQTDWSLDGEYARSRERTEILSVPNAIQIIIPRNRE